MVLGAGTTHAASVARELVKSAGGIGVLSRASPRELALVDGMGKTRANRIAAAFELGRRALDFVAFRPALEEPEDLYRMVAPRLAGLAQEVFLVVGIDVRQQVLDIVEVARGSVLGVEIHPREVFRPLVRMAAAATVVVHNHPSGDPTPSPDDLLLTTRMVNAGDIMGIDVVDHLILADQRYFSLVEAGRLTRRIR